MRCQEFDVIFALLIDALHPSSQRARKAQSEARIQNKTTIPWAIEAPKESF